MKSKLELDLLPEELKIVKSILAESSVRLSAWAFGSRVNGRAKKFSDLDLVLFGDGEIPGLTMAKLRDAFSESNLPFKVDLLDWSQVDENFRSIISQSYVVII